MEEADIGFFLFIYGCTGSSLLFRLFSTCGEWALVSSCCVRASDCGGSFVAVSRDNSSWGVWASPCVVSLVKVHGLYSGQASVVAAHRFSCPVARGIFPDQGSHPFPLHWQVDS